MEKYERKSFLSKMCIVVLFAAMMCHFTSAQSETGMRRKRASQTSLERKLTSKITSLERKLEKLEKKPRFAAELRPSDRSTNYYLPREYTIKNFSELIDAKSNFNPKTGQLEINEDDEEGFYEFHISAYKSSKNGGMIDVYKSLVDGGDVVRLRMKELGNDDAMINGVVTIHLKKGEGIRLYNRHSDAIYVSWIHPLTFTGYKI